MANFIDSLPDLNEGSFIDQLPDLNATAQPEEVDPVDFIPEPTVAEDYVAPVPEEEGKGVLGTAAEVPVNMLGAIGSFAKETVGTVIDWPVELMNKAITPYTGDITTFNKADATPEQLQLYNDAEGTRLFSIGSTDFTYVNPEQLQYLLLTL